MINLCLRLFVLPLILFINFLYLSFMPTSKDSHSSRGWQYQHPTAACGILGNHALWFETDFVVLNELIGAPEESSIWLCGTEIRRERRFLMGDPACDRIIFKPKSFETVFREGNLKIRYLLEVNKRASSLSANDSLVLVLVGCGEEGGGSFEIGDNQYLEKSELEESVRGTEATIWLVNTACYSGTWESPLWTLLASAEADKASLFIVSSDPDNGDSETHVGPVDVNHAKLPSVSCPHRSLHGVLNWMHGWRNQIGQTCTSTDSVSSPCPESPRPLIPFRSLESHSATLHLLLCEPPSPTAGDSSATSSVGSSYIQSSTSTTQPPMAELFVEEAKELLKLAQDFIESKPLQTSRETEIIVRCLKLIRDQATVNMAIQHSLFSELKRRRQTQNIAIAIARNLGWAGTVNELGKPNSIKQGVYGIQFSLQKQAEASGCLVRCLVAKRQSRGGIQPYAGAAGWLARIWQAAGCKTISKRDWDSAVNSAMQEVDGPVDDR